MMGKNPRKFWDNVPPDDPKLSAVSELFSDRPNWRDNTWPLVLHSDGGRFTNKNSDSLLSVQFKSLLAEGFGMSIFPIFCIAKSACDTHTNSMLWEAAAHYINSLACGLHPEQMRGAKSSQTTRTTNDTQAVQSLANNIS
ncbi:unnamed protein product [Prorocentrum cordatum]|uniref:Uncharacterized protein n=1 Tax=Prorocentrum cordatum TaxID=2364126 RepID=A0ABN9QGE7_9DINO|nr:unnamed protein product [Polarella glacialis]